jgi:iron-sulfur cluster assembly protein
MSMVTLQTETPKGAVAAPTVAAAPPSPVLIAEGESAASKSIQLTVRALKRIRVAMAKEGIAPDAGGLRLGITGGGCSGLSYNIRFDTQPRERDRVFAFPQSHLDAVSSQSAPAPAAPDAPAIRIFVDPKSFIYLSGHDPRLRRNPHAPGLQLHQPPLHQILRLRLQLLHLESRRLFSGTR